jgi:hypothetical protein
MSGDTIVPASVADADEIGAMHVRSWQGAYRGLMPQEYLDQLDPASRADRWRQILRDGAVKHDGTRGFLLTEVRYRRPLP